MTPQRGGGLRTALIALGVAGLVAVGAVLVAGFLLPGLLTLAMLCALMVLGLAFERWRYKRTLENAPIGPDWAPTAERFVDPETGRPTTVWQKAATGERAYVLDAGSAGPSR